MSFVSSRRDLLHDVTILILTRSPFLSSVLEFLTLSSFYTESLDKMGVVSWLGILPFIPFIRDHITLKSLTICFNNGEFDAHVVTVCFDTVAMLEGNTTLECLDINSGSITRDVYFAALESLQLSSTLKKFNLSPVLVSITLDSEGMKQGVSLVKKLLARGSGRRYICALPFSPQWAWKRRKE
jgi:hypothetical protein